MRSLAIRVLGLEFRGWLPGGRAVAQRPPRPSWLPCIAISCVLVFLFAIAGDRRALSQESAPEAPSVTAVPSNHADSPKENAAAPSSNPPHETLSTASPSISENPVTSTARVDDVKAYLWSVYQRSPTKVDSHGDFTWKDAAAAEHSRLLIEDYVIGGMDPDFRELLFAVGHAMDAVGVEWTILSAFRDDYRQNLASGLKARVNNSFHGGSEATGGYGHGCAVDLASVDRLSDDKVWGWLDRKGREFGLYRPLRAADPAHVIPALGWHELGAMLEKKRLGNSADVDSAPLGNLVTLEQYLCVRPLPPEKPAPGAEGAQAFRHQSSKGTTSLAAKHETNSRGNGPPQKPNSVHEAQTKPSGSHDVRRTEAMKHATPK
jgi:hypothetical protein